MKLRYIFASVLMFVFVTLVAWAYNKVVLQGDTGLTVPLIKADEGPYKVPPRDPGGLDVPHQDSTIYDALDNRMIAEAETVKFTDGAATADEETQATEQPILKKGFILEQGKLAEDKPTGVESLFAADNREQAIARAKKNIEAPQKPFISNDDIENAKVDEEKGRLAPEELDAGIVIDDGTHAPDMVKAPKPRSHPRRSANAMAIDVPQQTGTALRQAQAPSSEKKFSEVLEALQQDTKESENESTVPAMDVSAFASLRDYIGVTKPVRNAEGSVLRSVSTDVSSMNGADKKYFVQLASVPNEGDASKEWAVLKQRYGSVLGRLAARYKNVNIEGRGHFTRIQAGPMSEAQARQICADLQTAGKRSGCIVVSD